MLLKVLDAVEDDADTSRLILLQYPWVAGLYNV